MSDALNADVPPAGHSAGHVVIARLDALARCSGDTAGLKRVYRSTEHTAAAAQVRARMQEAGMPAARIDEIGNAVGRYETTQPVRPALLPGSHVDTVRNAGQYDGRLGAIAATQHRGAYTG